MAQYAERFGELFDRSVAARTRSLHPVACELSGGLDSSYVAATAAEALARRGRGPLVTASVVFDATRESDERSYIHAVLDDRPGAYRPLFVPGDDISPMSNLDEALETLDDGIPSGTQHLIWRMLQLLRAQNVRTLLSGVDGDNVVGHGHLDLRDFLDRGDVARYVREAAALVERYGAADHRHPFEDTFASMPGMTRAYLLPALYRQAADRRLGRTLHMLVQMRRFYRIAWRSVLREAAARFYRGGSAGAGPPHKGMAWADPAAAEAFRLEERAADYAHPAPRPTQTEYQRSALASGYLWRGIEETNLYAAVHGVEVAFPFMDRRLVEYALALPPECRLHDGWTRYVMRLCMAGRLPEVVAWRVGKGRLTAPFMKGILKTDRDLLLSELAPGGPLEGYVNRRHLDDALARLDALDETALGRLVSLATLSMLLKKKFASG